MMVWHAYLLNPMYVSVTIFRLCLLTILISWYAEDTMRLSTLSGLSRYTAYLTTHLVGTHSYSRSSRLIEVSQDSPDLLLTHYPDPDRVQFWRDHTLIPYDPYDSAGVLTNIKLRCPHCESWTDVRGFRSFVPSYNGSLNHCLSDSRTGRHGICTE